MPRRSATVAIGTGRSTDRDNSAIATTAYRDFAVTEIIGHGFYRFGRRLLR
jgi:hypothetical protein